MPSVFDYSDYRVFLRDVFQELKNAPSGFSYARFCKALGLKSTNFMKLVIEGKRDLTSANSLRISDFLGMTFEETRYLETLVAFNQSATPHARNHYSSCLRSLRSKRPVRYQRSEHIELLDRWYFPAVLVALHRCPTQNALTQVRLLVGLPSDVAQEAIESLSRSGALKIQDGRYELSDLNLMMTDKKGLKQKYKAFLRDQLRLSCQKLETEYGPETKFLSQTFSISRKSWTIYVSLVQTLIAQLAAQSDSEPAEQLLQLNVQMFPLISRRN